MSEDLSDVVRNGFDTYRHNLKISIPFLLYLLLVISAMLVTIAILLHDGGFESEELMPLWFLVFLLAILLVSIFWAGTVGMAKEATLGGKTSLSTMHTEGKKHYLGVLLAEMGLFVIFMIGAFTILIPLAAMGEAAGSLVVFLFFILLFLFILFAVALGYVVPVSIVVDDLGAGGGIKRGFRFISSNKRDVILILVLFLVASIAIDLAAFTLVLGKSAITGFDDVDFLELVEDFNRLSILTNFVQVVVLYPLFIVLWTRLYMSRTGRLGEEETETALEEIIPEQKEDRNGDQCVGQSEDQAAVQNEAQKET